LNRRRVSPTDRTRRAVPAKPRLVASPNRHLYERLREQLFDGHYRPGAKLPSTRVLAANLGVCRTTVRNAFEQLMAEGYLRGEKGSGTYVAMEPPRGLTAVEKPQTQFNGSHLSGESSHYPKPAGLLDDVALARPRAMRPFQPGIPALGAFPFGIWSKLLQRQWRRRYPQSLANAGAAGFPALRKAVVSYLAVSRGIQCQPERVIIVSGIQQALHLASQALLKPGDPVWMEEPGYFAARQVFQASAARVVPVEVDSEGISVSAGILASPKARLVYTTPGVQFPLGSAMSIARRGELLQWAAKSKAWIVEDDDCDFRYSSRPYPTLQGLDRDGTVIYLGTFSKLLFPGLRLGYMVVPDALVDRMVRAKYLTDWHSSIIDQTVLSEFMDEGHFLRHLRRMRALYLERLEALLDYAQSELSGILSIVRPDAGIHLLASLAHGTNDRAAHAAAEEVGVSTLPLSMCYLGPPRASGLMMGYAAYTPTQIKQGCRALARALRCGPPTN
jgi:GntR family transcriptional regulator / MocR family aminotransferase